MDTGDAVHALAQAEAFRCRPLTDPDELADYSKQVPVISLAKTPLKGWTATGSGHAGHENEGRMDFLCGFLNARVLPMIDPLEDISGAYRIELHDSYSYLPDADKYENCLTFGRPRGDRRSAALIPDPYHMGDFNDALRHMAAGRSLDWGGRAAKFFFAGTTTGDRDPAQNERIRACIWSLTNRDISDFRITNIAQMHPDLILARVPQFQKVLHPYAPLEAHHAFRYQLNVVGNTACWSRVPMVLASGSLLVNLRHRDVMWYYPLLTAGEQFVEIHDLAELRAMHAALEGSPGACRRMIEAGNRFCEKYMKSDTAASYLATFLEAAAHHGRK